MTALHPLATAVDHPSPAKGKLPAWRLVAGLLLAPAAFSVQVVASYVVAALGCGEEGAPRVLLIIVNLIAVAATFGGAGVAIANFRATRDEKNGGHSRLQEVGEGRTRFLAYFGVCASLLFGLAVLVQLTSIFTVSQCLGFASSN